jgi:hypothetical protein
MPSNIYQPRPSTIRMEARSGTVGMEEAVYCNTNEGLEVMTVSSVGGNPNSAFNFSQLQEGVALTIDMRMLTVNAGLQYLTFMVSPTNDYTPQTIHIKLPEGFILSCNAYTTGKVRLYDPATAGAQPEISPCTGETWVALAVVATNNPAQYTGTFLCQGYVTNGQRVTYPARQPISYQDGYPFVRRQPGPVTPASMSYQVPLNAINEITGIYYVLNTSATTGNRIPLIGFARNFGSSPVPDPVLVTPFPSDPVSANTQTTYFAAQGFPLLTYTVKQTTGAYHWCSLPQRLRLQYHDYVYPIVNGVQSGDTVQDFTIWGNEWLMP